VGYDLTYKTDLVEKLPAPPELVMLGGSRAQRFERSHIERVTGLSAFNFAVQNCRPEDAYAISRYLIERAPRPPRRRPRWRRPPEGSRRRTVAGSRLLALPSQCLWPSFRRS
jgi:hypothetical protein